MEHAPNGDSARQLQFMPHNDTSPTQAPSQELLQQNGSTAQIVDTQLGLIGGLSHPADRAVPKLHSVCEHAPALSAQVRLPQMVRTSLTH